MTTSSVRHSQTQPDIPEGDRNTNQQASRPIWEIAAEIAAKVPDDVWAKVPTDLAKTFDEPYPARESA